MQPGGEMAAGGGGPWPPFFLGDGAGMDEGLHLTAAALEKENSWWSLT